MFDAFSNAHFVAFLKLDNFFNIMTLAISDVRRTRSEMEFFDSDGRRSEPN
jgi:hypothetical protein